MNGSRTVAAALAACGLLGIPAEAAVPKATHGKEFRHPGLFIPTRHVPVARLDARTAAAAEADLAGLEVPPAAAFYDPLWKRWGSLLPARPLIPGDGVGNTLAWRDLGLAEAPAAERLETAAWSALVEYLRRAPALGVRVEDLPRVPRVAVHDGGRLIQIHAQRHLSGIPVRDSSVTAVLNSGNLVLLGLHNWGDAGPASDPALAAADARAIVAAHASPELLTFAGTPRLEFVPFAAPEGYGYRLAWVVDAASDRDPATWEGLVDAGTGELLAFEDRNAYASVKKIVGGVYPFSNDGIPPDGIEMPGFPMPFADVLVPGTAAPLYANSAGVAGCLVSPAVQTSPTPGIDPLFETRLSGPYVRIADVCGPVRERYHFDSSSAADLGAGTGTNCARPPGRHSPGDTHASRTSYYELNRIAEQGRGYLPANAWLQRPLLSNVNISGVCNAFWNGTSVNFYRLSTCRNTGELAGVIDHEWGHGMDANGVNPNIASPGEGIADIHAAYRLADSCPGRGMLPGPCPGYGDACTVCTGARDVDWARRVSGQPHGLSWIDANCGTGSGPCGGGVHCEGAVYAEAAWDLYARDLRAAPFNYDANTALEISTRLFVLGSGPVVQWFQCTPPDGGCLATGGYMNVLAVDDDNGSLLDGTPHMAAIHAAFARHDVACAAPPPSNGGCAAGPAAAPVLTASARDQRVALAWTPVAGAAAYEIFRTEGVRGCAFGKTRVGRTSGTAFVDGGLMNGFGYHYAVLPVGAADSCRGRMSNCVAVSPVPGANARTLPPAPVAAVGGDGDGTLDNCETGRVLVRVENDGQVGLTNVRVVAATSPTHPLTVVATPLPATIAAALAPCDSAGAAIDVVPHGMTFGETFELTVTVTADQIAPETRAVTFTSFFVESDFQAVASRVFTFNAGLEGWTVPSGTFVRVETGPGSGNFFLASSSCLDLQCDVARSPALRLQANTTLTIAHRYDTETPAPVPFDRASLGVVDAATGARTTVIPDSGDPYDLAPGAPNGACTTAGQAGWSADTDADCTAGAAFLSSGWTAAALNPGGAFTGRVVRLSVDYGTDPVATGFGFHFDDVTLANVQLAVPDAQVCTLQPRPAPREEVRTRSRSRRSPGRTSG